MKRVLALVITLLMVASLMPFAASAEEIADVDGYEGKAYVIFDNICANEETNLLSPLGGASAWIVEHDGVIEDTESAYRSIFFTGWVAFDQEIKGFGYRIDDGEIVYKDEFKREADEAVMAAAASVPCDYASRYVIGT